MTTASSSFPGKASMSEVACLLRRGKLSRADRRKHCRFDFTVPTGTTELRIRFLYRPGTVGGLRNLLTLTLFDPLGFRGAAHRWQVEQEIVLGSAAATPGFFRGPVHPGQWQVEIDTHEILNEGGADGWCEYELSVHALLEPEGHGHRSCSDPRRSPPGPARLNAQPGWYRGDLHSHNHHCDGSSSVEEMARAAAGQGLDFLAMTCHNTTSWLGEAVAFPESLLPVRGLELTTYFGHANVLGIREWVDWRAPGEGHGAQPLLEQAALQEALVVVNHPRAAGSPHCTGCRWDYDGIDFGQVHCMEVWNSVWDARDVGNQAALELWTDLLNEGFRLAAVAGTDSHSAEDFGADGLGFTWVYAKGLGEREILGALRQGRAFLSRGPEVGLAIRARNRVDAVAPGAELGTERWGSLVVQVRALRARARLWLISDGEPRAWWDVGPPGAELAAGSPAPERWARWELRRGTEPDGDLVALTNPLYRQIEVAHPRRSRVGEDGLRRLRME